MGRAWLNILGADTAGPGLRLDLKPGLTMLGGLRGDVAVQDSGSDSVHLWSEPPKLIFVGAGEPPRVNGQAVLEVELRAGDRIEWRGFSATFGFDDGQARLEEVAGVAAPQAAAPRASGAALEPVSPGSAAAWRQLKAGMLAELALADRGVIKRWQESVMRGEFDSAAAERDLLASAPAVADADPRLAERSTRLMRDLLMSSVTRSAGRQVRKVARTGLAFLVVQTGILILFILLVLAALLLVHVRGHSIDALFERFLDLF